MPERDIEQENLDIQALRQSARLGSIISHIAIPGAAVASIGSVVEFASDRPATGAILAIGTVVMGVIGIQEGRDALQDSREAGLLEARQQM
jgi:hypothetical protein